MKVTIRSQDVLSATVMVPNRRNCQNTPPLVRFTNCGIKARKKIAVFGFRTSVAIPCQKGFLRAWPSGDLNLGIEIFASANDHANP